MSTLRLSLFLILLTLTSSPLTLHAHETDREIYLEASALLPDLMNFTEFGVNVTYLMISFESDACPPNMRYIDHFYALLDTMLKETKNMWVKKEFFSLRDHVHSKAKTRTLITKTDISAWVHAYLIESSKIKADPFNEKFKNLCQKTSEPSSDEFFFPLQLLRDAHDRNIEASFLESALAEFGHLNVPKNPMMAFISIHCSQSPTNEGIAQLVLRLFSGTGFTDPIPYASKAFYLDYLKRHKKSETDLKPFTKEDLIKAWKTFYKNRPTKDSLEDLGLGDFLKETCPSLTPDLAAALLEASAPARKHAMNCTLQKKYFVPYGANARDKSREPAMTRWIQYLQEPDNQ